MVKYGVTDPKRINAISNLRPLWAVDNLKRRFNGLDDSEKQLFKKLEPTAFARANI